MNISPDSLFRQIDGQSDGMLPPVHLWHPGNVQDIGMRITKDGTWWYQDSPIKRDSMVRLFSRVLRREGPDYFLVTPAEKVKVEVEAAPLLAVRMEIRDDARGREIAFGTNVGDVVVADGKHPIRMRGTPDAPLPVVVVRDDIEALIVRSVFYELVEQADLASGDVLVVSSRGEPFVLGAV